MTEIPEIKKFQEADRIYVRAQQIWLILVGNVMNSKRDKRNPYTITYGDLALLMGYTDRRVGHTLARHLGTVGEYCVMNKLPALNAIVVNEKTGVPGHDVVLTNGNNWKEEQSAVMRQDWYSIRVPTTGTFRKVMDATR